MLFAIYCVYYVAFHTIYSMLSLLSTYFLCGLVPWVGVPANLYNAIFIRPFLKIA